MEKGTKVKDQRLTNKLKQANKLRIGFVILSINLISMETQDSNQHRKPYNKPDRPGSEPKMPGKEDDKSIIEGAGQSDQLEKLKPDANSGKAPHKSGSPPVKEPGK